MQGVPLFRYRAARVQGAIREVIVYKARCLYIFLLYIQTMYRYAKYVHKSSD